MKANEAPERIYLYPSDRAGEAYEDEWGDRPWGDSVEYTRTDAFIEKVCEWLSDTLQTVLDVNSPLEHHVESIPALGSITQTEFLSKFRKEIKYLFD